jgi:hypothetical protein
MMTSLTRVLLAVWIAIGIPLFILVNFWTGKWFNPIDIMPGKDFEYYLMRFFIIAVCYVLPIYLSIKIAKIFMRLR